MAAEASVALMHRITNVRLPGPLPGDGDQRYAIDLDEQGLICRIEAMGGEAQQTDADWNGDWLSPRGVDLQINGGLGLAFPELTSADLPRLEELLDLLWRDGV
ncbi:MAG: N-acetylglucosamine-6-phosphate deacetylase, partial [Synechococcus sp.]